MTKRKRITPFKQKGKGGEKKEQKTSEIEIVKIHAAKNIAKLEVMTEEELSRIKQVTAQNALNLFNDLIKEMQRRIPQMTDEMLSASLFSVWEESAGKK
jgi:hypothetical protein